MATKWRRLKVAGSVKTEGGEIRTCSFTAVDVEVTPDSTDVEADADAEADAAAPTPVAPPPL